jgi:hypothetical protein
MQELLERSVTMVLAKANKVAESSQGIPPLTESISKSPGVIEIQSDWHTLFMIHLKTGGLLEDKDQHDRLRNRARPYTLQNDELFQ